MTKEERNQILYGSSKKPQADQDSDTEIIRTPLKRKVTMMARKETDNFLFANLRSLISLIDKLRDFGLDDYISLPRIAVLGTQSAGKSSLLEAVCGMNFLPRGSGVVTRRPLELRMVQNKKLKEPYFVFDKDYPGEK